MKKPSLNLGAGGIQGLLAQHVEKIVLTVVMGLVGFFIYSGYSKEGYTKNPAELHMKATSAQSHVGLDTSLTRITSEKRDRVEPYKERVQQSQRPMVAGEYAIMPLNPTLFPPTQPRQDPELFAPLSVETESFLVSVYEQVEDGVDPFQDDKNAGAPKKAAPAKKPDTSSSKKKNDPKNPPMMPMPGGKNSKGGDKGGGMPMIPTGPPGGMGSMDGSEMAGGAEGGGAMGGMTASSSVSESYMQKYIRGYRPSGGGFQGITGAENAGPRGMGVSRYVIAVKAVIPHQKLVDEYRRVFSEAQGYDLMRDTPRYVYYNVERAEVGADAAAEPKWEQIRVSNAWKARAELQAGNQMVEVADARYVDPVLTQAIPPAMFVDPVKFGLHSEVPRASAAVGVGEEETGPKKKKGKGPGSKEDGSEDAPDGFAGAAPGGGPNMPGMPGMPGMRGGPTGGPPGLAGAGGPAGMPSGMGGPGMGGPGMGGPGMGGPGMGGPGMGMGGPGMGMGGPGMGMGGPGMGGMSYGQVAESVKYKMIRFYDFDVDPTKKYQYRVRVWVEDPNHPQLEDSAPSQKILAVKVAERVKALDDKERAGGKRVYYRMTDWSKPSNPIGLPKPVRFVAGAARHGASLEIRELKITVPTQEPSATLLPIVWDFARAIEVPGYADVPDEPKKPTDKEAPSAFRGSVLNFRKDARVLKPDSLELKLIEKHRFVTNAVVVDMRPSEPLRDGDKRPNEKPPLLSSGELLIVDAEGNLIVRSELDDVEDYRKFMFVGEEKDSGATGGAGMMGGGPMSGPDGMGMDPGGIGGVGGVGGILGEPKKGKNK